MKRIFMLSSHPLFSQGVESLLRRETGLEIVGREADADENLARTVICGNATAVLRRSKEGGA
jgi:DNA-binding NarL/FixJ family response regulator